jgi:NNP family nitrate/nitrite transporter-like MFS transporter
LGIELTVESSATLHLANRFDLELADAAAYASLFGIMNIFSRGLGGVISDKMHAMYSLRGRLIVHMIFMLCEGILIFYFVRCGELNTTLVAMVAFAIFGQVRGKITFV